MEISGLADSGYLPICSLEKLFTKKEVTKMVETKKVKCVYLSALNRKEEWRETCRFLDPKLLCPKYDECEYGGEDKNGKIIAKKILQPAR
jgi:hypothetical protein